MCGAGRLTGEEEFSLGSRLEHHAVQVTVGVDTRAEEREST